MIERLARPTTAEIRGSNDGGEWEYGHALASAWSGDTCEAEAHFESALAHALAQGNTELHLHITLQHIILRCRCEQRPVWRHHMAHVLGIRLSELEWVEDYRAPFRRVPGRWLAESLAHDVDDPGFLLHDPPQTRKRPQEPAGDQLQLAV